MTQTLFVGRFISAPAPEQLSIREGAVLIGSTDGHGRVEKTSWTATTAEDAFKEFGLSQSDVDVKTCKPTGFFFPGFIDTHIHASQYPNSGIFGKSTLLDWLTTYTFPLEASLGEAQTTKPDIDGSATEKSKLEPYARARAVYNKVVERTLSNGTTTASYFATISVPATNILADIAYAKGQRAYIGRVCMDNPATCPEYYCDESAEDALAKTKESVEYIRKVDPTGELLAPIITPRFAPSCQARTLSALGEIAQSEDLRVQTHIAENVGECAWVKELFPERKSYTDVYDHAGLLGAKTILAHGIHFSDEEIETIRQRGASVSHCPASNSALGSGFCPVRKLLESGVTVSLGTDVSGGYSVSILDSVRQTCLVSRQLGYVQGGDKKWNIGVTEALWLATVGGAKSVAMEGQLGGFEPGMLWDVQEIDLGTVEDERECGPVDIFGWETWEERIEKWTWAGTAENVKNVWVGGRRVHGRD